MKESRWESNIARHRKAVDNLTIQDLESMGVTGRAKEHFLKTLDETKPNDAMKLVKDLAKSKTAYI